MDSLAANLDRVRERMAGACARAHRAEVGVRLLAATKTVAAERIREAHGLGLRLFGENRVQERWAKRDALADLEAEWHLIGPLQSNKVARALGGFDAIDGLDRLEVAQRLDRLAAQPVPVLIEVNIGREAAKAGVMPEEAPALAAAIRALPRLRLRGLMAIPPAAPAAEASRPYFAALAALAADLAGGEVWELSMGMSHDFGVAIEEGATLIRVGSALFGERAPLR